MAVTEIFEANFVQNRAQHFAARLLQVFNRFADIVDLDRYGDETYDEEAMIQMSEKLAWVLLDAGLEVESLSRKAVEQAKSRAVFGKLGIPYLVNRLTVEGEKDHD